jgi:predicted O-linked N-acetylglucosamine transferase (SPINDLY family)
MTRDAFATALAHQEAGRLDHARTLYRDILASDPDHIESLHLLGLITAGKGQPEAGAEMIRRAMGLAPGRAPHHNSLATVYRLLGRDADALAEFRAAADQRPLSAEIHNNLATTLRSLGYQNEAVEEYRLAAKYGPEIAEIWCNLAGALADQGDEAEIHFRHAIGLRPEYAVALANFGRWLTTRARWIEAAACLSEAVRLAPADTGSWNNLGIARKELGRGTEAEVSFRRAVALDPNCADAHYNFGCLLAGDGRADDAVACHAAAIAADPLHGAARLALCIARLPVIYGSEAEVAERRADYLTALDDLAAGVETPAVARAVAGAVGTSQPFFLPYQGEDDRAAQTMFGGLVCRLLVGTPGGTTGPPPLATRPPKGQRIRLGIVSGWFQDHTIFRLFLESWLAELDRDRFEIVAFHTGQSHDRETARAATLSGRFVHGLTSAAQWREAVLREEPHVLLYPEVGMDPVAARLAAQRLAPVQCVAWGHPETTGMPTMDYFLSADLMEPPGADAHYTEQLVRLPGLGLHYTPDDAPVDPLDRASLGLDPTGPVYWSGQAVYKYHPGYDQVFPRIAAAVGACQFVFIGFAKSDAVTAAFRDRLWRAFAAFGLDASRYCVILPPMDQRRFIAAVGTADVVLDTPGWSGGRSTLDCLAQSPAIVTLPGRFMRGRHTAAILRRIGCDETIAGSLDDYVAIAVRLGLDGAWRARVRRAVRQGKYRAFRDAAPIRALEAFLAEAVSRV